MYVSNRPEMEEEWWPLPSDESECIEELCEMVTKDTTTNSPPNPTPLSMPITLERPTFGLLDVFKRPSVSPPTTTPLKLSMEQTKLLLSASKPTLPTSLTTTNSTQADLIVKRAVPMKPPRLTVPSTDDDEDEFEVEMAGGWRAAFVAVILSACISLLFVTVSVPLDLFFSLSSTPSPDSVQSTASSALPELFDWRTMGQLMAVVSACREVQVAKRVALEMATACLGVVQAEPVRMVVKVLAEIVEALRQLLMAFY